MHLVIVLAEDFVFAHQLLERRRMVLSVSFSPLIIRTASSSDQGKCFINCNNEIITSLTRRLAQ